MQDTCHPDTASHGTLRHSSFCSLRMEFSDIVREDGLDPGNTHDAYCYLGRPVATRDSSAHPHRRRRLRRSVCRASARARRRRRHDRRPPELSPVSAAALPGGDRRLAAADVASPIRSIRSGAQHEGTAWRGRGHRLSAEGRRARRQTCRYDYLSSRPAPRIVLRPRRLGTIRAGAQIDRRRVAMRRRILRAFEAAEMETDAARREPCCASWSSAQARPAWSSPARWPSRALHPRRDFRGIDPRARGSSCRGRAARARDVQGNAIG